MFAKGLHHNGLISEKFLLDAEWFVPNLRWYYIELGNLLLFWDIHELVERNVEEIEVSAKQTFGLGQPKKTNASVYSGVVTLENLTPDTLYSINVRGYAKKTLIFGSRSLIRTHPSGKFH